ncbi:MAG: RraA family protein [Acidobacteria bacterium]|nr:RraA family protein [Acidobacteriota bacterium]
MKSPSFGGPFAAFAGLSTPAIADACMRLRIDFRIASPGIAPVVRGQKLAGPVLPVRHHGSVDVFLEACHRASPGEVLVIDNQGRTDEGCIGDLTVLEARGAGLAGVVVWGCHRDSDELVRIGLPVFSYGVQPAGPRGVRVAPSDPSDVPFCSFSVGAGDCVFADSDGVIFTSSERLTELMARAVEISRIERKQAELIESGHSLRRQLRFDEYLEKRRADPSYTFRRHLRGIGGAIEE